MANFTGTAGNDTFTGTSGDDTFDLQQGGKDTASGLGGDDVFNLGAQLAANDQLDGGAGHDQLYLDGTYALTLDATTIVNIETIILTSGHNYDLTTNEGNVAAGETLTIDASALGAGNQFVFNGIAERDGSFDLTGGAGDDVLAGGDHEPYTGPAMIDTFNLGQGGNDTVTAGYNATNVVTFGSTFTAADKVGGSTGAFGTLTVVLNGNYAGGNALVLNGSTLAYVDTVQLTSGHSYTITTANTIVGRNGTLIDGSALGSGDILTFDGSAQNSGNYHVNGGAGDDQIIGAPNGSISLGGVFDLSRGGSDTVTGGSAIDTFLMGSKLNAGDRIDGVATNSTTFGDVVVLDGDYSGTHSVTFSATTMVNVENIRLTAGHGYSLTTNEATVSTGSRLEVDGSTLGASDVLKFNGAAETDGQFTLFGGAANDILTGGSQSDFFDLTHGGIDTVTADGGDDEVSLGARLTALDAIKGGNGFDTVTLDGDYSAGVVFGSATLENFESMTLAAGHSYNLTTANSTVVSGGNLHVYAGDLASGQDLTFDGSAETNGTFQISSGDGDDTLTGGSLGDFFDTGAGQDAVAGGSGDDSIAFGTHFSTLDFFDGGGGNDSVFIDNKISGLLTLSSATLKHVESLILGNHSYNIATQDNLVAADAQLYIYQTTSDASFTLKFDGSAESNGSFAAIGGIGDDHIRTGQKSDALSGGGGADFLRGGSGNDFYFYGTPSESTGADYDTIYGFTPGGDGIVTNNHISDVETKVTHGSLSTASFDSDLAAAIGSGHMGAGRAVLFTPDAGTLSGKTFLVVDDNGVAGYQAGEDFVFRMQAGNSLNSLSAADFYT
jgi:Ca2+-binding RTX toxin-like protein